jgi:hypothetical protein
MCLDSLAVTMRIAISVFTLILLLSASSAETQEGSVATTRIPSCGKPQSGHKLVRWGKYGLQFSVPKHGVKVLRGRPDVDYVRFAIKPNDADVTLVLEFGGMAMSPEPGRETLNTSASFTQTKLLDSKGATIGIDSRGETHEHTRWRRFTIGAEGAVYENVSAAHAALFDQIVESACLIPYPNR